MSDSNRLLLTSVREATLGVTPASPNAVKKRVTGEDLAFNITNTESDEIRPDRLIADIGQVNANVGGTVNAEISYGAFDDFIESAMFMDWNQTPVITNATADTEISDVDATTDTFTVSAGGTAFVDQHLVRASGFGEAGNNALHEVVSSTATSIVVTDSPGLANEAVVPLNARLKVVGFVGASGDIAAVSGGLTSTLLDFTTLGLSVGQWIKIGGTSAANKFDNAANNTFVRVTSIAANALGLDNLPTGWTADLGGSKAIQVWMSDYIRNGTTTISHSIERSVQSQQTPTYYLSRGCVVNRMDLNITTESIMTMAFDFLGFEETASVSPMDANPDDAPQEDVLTAATNVGRLLQDGSDVAGVNLLRSLTVSLNNNLRNQTAIGTLGLVGMGVGTASVTGTIENYFDNDDEAAKFRAGTPTSASAVVEKNNKAIVVHLPRIKYDDDRHNASGRNQDVLQRLNYIAIADSLTGTHLQLDRFEEYAA